MDDGRWLYVLRHAKSSWDDPGVPDHDRPLTPRGERAARLLAAYVAERGIRPELVLCSPARRAQQTLEGVSPGGVIETDPRLYGTTASELVARLREMPDRFRSVMLVGHNPALQMLVLRLAYHAAPDGETAERLAQVRRKFPTGALATLSVSCEWRELRAGCATLLDYVRPKALAAA